MRALKRDLDGILKGLKVLMKKADKAAKKAARMGRAQTARPTKRITSQKPKLTKRKVAAKAASRRAARTTALASVFDIIRRKSRSGADTGQIKKKTGFDDKKIWNVINRLKAQGRVKSARKGIYVKV